MTLTVRTDHRVEQELAEFLEKHSENQPTPWELLKDLIPVEANPLLPSDLSSRRKEYLSVYFKEKHARRRLPAGRDV